MGVRVLLQLFGGSLRHWTGDGEGRGGVQVLPTVFDGGADEQAGERERPRGVRSVLLVLLLVLMAGGLAACGGEPTDLTTAPETTTTATTADTTTGTSTTGSGDATREATIASITEDMVRIRGLALKHPIDTAYITRDQLTGELDEQIAEEYPPGEVVVEEKILKELGLLEPDVDLIEFEKSLLGGSILGYYDDETGELKVISETGEMGPTSEITLAHEITHALQDQNFSVLEILPPDGSGNDDRDLAVLSLMEGDATAAEESYAAEKMGMMDALGMMLDSLGAPMALGSSSYLEDGLVFPYVEGRDFVGALMEDGGWDEVNQAYAEPPQSTEQIMHPEKYAAGEAPVMMQLPDLAAALGDGWQDLFGTDLGEFDMKELLGLGVSSVRASRAAAGWGGSRLEYLEGPGGERLTAMALAWDSVSEADEFTLTMQESLERQYGAPFVFQQQQLPRLKAYNGYWVMAQRGDRVVLVKATDAGTGQKAASMILDTFPSAAAGPAGS